MRHDKIIPDKEGDFFLVTDLVKITDAQTSKGKAKINAQPGYFTKYSLKEYVKRREMQ